MNRRSILSVSAPIALGLALFGITAGSTARAAEIKLLCAVALQPAMLALIPDFEKSPGHEVTIAYGTAGAVADRRRSRLEKPPRPTITRLETRESPVAGAADEIIRGRRSFGRR
jgi:hypothetical protein